jgi:large subunit ribosomal protein L49
MALRTSSRLFLRSPCSLRPIVAQQLYFSTSSPRRLLPVEATSATLTDVVLDDVTAATPSNSASGSESIRTRKVATQSKSRSLATPNATSKPSILPYHVSRTPSNKLPVYTDTRNGNTRKETIVRKIAGDPRPLRDAIKELLQVDVDRVWVGKVTGHVYVKGHHKPAIEKFLAEKGF